MPPVWRRDWHRHFRYRLKSMNCSVENSKIPLFAECESSALLSKLEQRLVLFVEVQSCFQDNVQVWAELGLAKGAEEGEDDEYHLTNYWLNNADESSKTEPKIERARKRNVNLLVEQTPMRDPSLASEEKSIIAHVCFIMFLIVTLSF